MTAIFHDIIYDPLELTPGVNEQNSMEFYFEHCKRDMSTVSDEDYKHVAKIITDTANHTGNLTSELSKVFCDMDINGFFDTDINRISDEMNVFKEYQFVDFELYRSKRMEILSKFRDSIDEDGDKTNLQDRINFLVNWRPNIGVYAGSFNPMHLGHMDVLQKADKIFDKVIVAIGKNPDKNVLNHIDNVRRVIPYVQVEVFEGFLGEYVVKKSKHCDVTIIKGIRNAEDVESEIKQLRYTEDFFPEHCNTIMIPCDRKYAHISSSDIRKLMLLDGDIVNVYLPEGDKI